MNAAEITSEIKKNPFEPSYTSASISNVDLPLSENKIWYKEPLWNSVSDGMMNMLRPK
jgi:hypothetical protein